MRTIMPMIKEPADAGSSSGPSASTDIPAPAAETNPPLPVGKTPEEWRQELDLLREPLKDGLGRRALALVDEHPSLVFDVQRVFVGPATGYRDQAVRLLLDDIKAFSSAAYDHQEQPMSVRCRLLALVLNDPTSPMSSMAEEESAALLKTLLALLLSNPVNGETGHPTVPKWLASHLLVTEALLTMSEDPPLLTLPKEGEPIPEAKVGPSSKYTEARTTVFEFCMRLLAIPSLPRDELLSSLRLFVLLTRDHAIASDFARRDGVSLLFRLLKGPENSTNAVGTHPYIAIILRHIVEDPVTLHNVMQQEIKHFFSLPRNRLMDVGNFVRNCGAMALRDARTFVEVVAETCQLSHPYNSMKNISLKDSTKTNASVGTNEGNETDMQVDSPAPSRSAGSGSSETLDNLVHFLIAELIKSVKAEHLESSSSEDKGHNPEDQHTSQDNGSVSASSSSPADYTYACFLMQCLTELLFSYDSCKIAFLSYSPKKRFHTPAKETGHKHRTAALQFLISELMSFGTINPTPPPEAKRQISLCNWAMSVVVALCVDTTPAHDIKDVPPDRVSVRKFVLEAINRAIKELPTSEGTEAHYSRLLALADLCYRLLTVRFNTTSRKANDEVPTHLAKVMLEKNFVATLTNALAEVDPNYPNIRGVITGILRPLEYLTKIAIKMSRVSEKHKDNFVEPEESLDSEMSEEDEDTDDADREETPDLYRNSSLGIYGGEMEDVHYGPDDEMDEDVDEEEDAEMEYDHGETGSEDTSNTDEENGLEDDIENDSAPSEEDWHDEEDEDEDLVENDEEHDDEEDEGEEDEEDTGNPEVMWQDVAVGEGEDGEAGEDLDGDEADEDIPIISAHPEEEGDMMSEAEDYADELGVFVPNEGQGPQDVFTLGGFGNPFDGILEGNQRDTTQMFWRGMARPTRRHGAVEDDLEIFGGRSRGAPTTVPEGSVHPLLLDPSSTVSGVGSSSRSSRRPPRAIISGFPQDLLHSIEHVIGEGAVQLFQHILSGRGGGETIRIDVPPGGLIPQFGRHGRGGISAHIRLERAPRSGEVRTDGRGFEPLLTLQRWAEEAKTMHGRFEQSRVAKLTNYVVVALLPPAIEALKRARIEEEKEAERRREAREKAEAEEAAKRAEEERQREKEKAEEEARLAAEAEAVASQHANEDVDTEMVDASAEHEPVASGEPSGESGDEPSDEQIAGTSTAPERVTVMIHGNPVDITDTGIDPTFLEALPDEMREEVLNQHIRDQRAARVERPVDSQISPEFLDALPPELRAEIIQQETIERARRHPEADAEAQVAGVPADMDPADFIASLDPQLRQVVLMDSDDVFIQSLPPHMLAEAGIYREAQQAARAAPAAAAGGRRTQPPQPTHKQPVTREAIQLLDKHAIAVLVRLLFFPQVLKKNILSKVLVNLSENTRTRTDIFNLLLGILQDGTGDLSSIDKSFAQISFRSKPSAQSIPKPASKVSLPQPEVVPELVAQRCLDALAYITGANEASSVFFLTEQELPAGLRRAPSKKGKGKEKQAPQTYYPIVLLLAQLDRQSLLRTPSLMEAIVQLLALVTRPLASLKDNKKKDITADDTAISSAQAASSAPQGVTNTPTSSAAPAPAPAPTTPAATATTANAPEGTTTSQAPAAEEKVLLAHPPVIPQPILRLVVNILTTGECSGRTFSHTLALIQHLSFIPGARDEISRELCARAQEFGHQLHQALDELATALREARADDVAISVASKFSPASSDQAKLLRLLKTIDYMHSPKSLNTSEASNEDVERVQNIYESFRFTALWRRLGDCLAIIEEQPELEHIATVLLPLIESLMVVCKYVGPKTASSAASRTIRASMSPKSPTTGRESMEDLFVTFTEAHRKVLNLMVRNNPSLMSGSFSLLVNNPRVLDFDNKRNYFNQQLHRRPHTREHYGTLQLNVRRQRVFEDSFQVLQRKTGEQIKYGKLSVRFYEEEGVDAGGVTREWFQILARQMFDPNYCLFQPCAADRLTYQPNKASAINPEHLSFFKFVGRIIGKAIFDGRLLDAYFARSLYRQILGKPVDYRDVEWVDPEYYKSLCWILENDPSALELTFSVEADEFGVNQIIELKEGGASLPVTQENKREFVQLSAQYRLYSSIKDQIEALLTGFYEIIPKDLITIFDEKELELLISGTPDIDVDEWRSATEYNGYTSSDPVIVWFWRALKSFNREERAKVLSFATGTSRVPLGGFVDLQGVQGVQRFSIHRAYGDPDRLPQAHTCFNQIDLPQYSSYEMLRQQLLLAIHEGGEGFGFA
ncbi:hypothetical protein NM688_g3714 [Phlebia brevispora]|uniref:Uncharacterized protein n=1 Tax=Phlebia brevispora TaxID=194682 RepID=A0ACC1T567_9APHY|nr:hypothetical protein NM688_g3714 [Phlebia brevispora]